MNQHPNDLPAGSSVLHDQPKLRILHLILVLRATNSQYNEHSLPVMDDREITLCTFFEPQLEAPSQIRVVSGDGTVRGFLAALRTALQGSDYDAVHAHSPYTGILLLCAMVLNWRTVGRIRGRTVYTVHDSYHDFTTRHRLLMLPVLMLYRRVVFCSHAALNSFPKVIRRLVRKRTRVVQNGVDVDRIDRIIAQIEPDPDETFTVLSVARMEEVKEPLVLLEAFAQMNAKKARLVFVGDGEMRSDLEQAIEDQGLQDRVTLTGLIPREAVFSRFLNADVFISTSSGEGLPLAAMEAMACGLPVVLSDIAPHREFGADQAVIPLVAVGDAGGFGQQLDRLCALEQSERAEIGHRCRSLVDSHFRLEKMTHEYGSIYTELVKPADT